MPSKWFLNKQMTAVYHSDRHWIFFFLIVWVELTETLGMLICIDKKASHFTEKNTQDELLENQVFYLIAIVGYFHKFETQAFGVRVGKFPLEHTDCSA